MTKYIYSEDDYMVDIGTLINLKVVRWLPIPKRFSAISIPPIVTLVRRSDWVSRTPIERFQLLLHELTHWEQASRYGALAFYIVYLFYSIRYGYNDNPLEIEARERAGI